MIDPILLDCPTSIKTDRLVIRPMMPYDGKIMYEAIQESIECFKQWFDWAEQITSVNDIEKTVRQFYAQFILRQEFHWLGFCEDRLVASCSLHRINWKCRSAEVGYWVRVSQQKQHFACEMVSALTRYGFSILSLQRLAILVDDENEASIKVAEKCGYTLEARTKGLYAKPGDETLRMSRCYVRFDCKQLYPTTIEIPASNAL